MRERKRFEGLIADLSTSFVGLPVNCIDSAIGGALHQTVEACGFDRGAYYQGSGKGLKMTHSWPAENLDAISNIEQTDNLKWLAGRLRRKVVLVLSKAESTSAETDQKELLLRLGLRSAVLVGVMTGRSLLGVLMLGSLREDFVWTRDLEGPLQILGAVFAEALARKQNEERLLESDQLSHAMLDSLECHIVVVTQRGRVIASSAGRHVDIDNSTPLLNGISLGSNVFDICREALEKGFEPAALLLEGIEAVVKGSREMFEMEYEYLSPSGQRFFQVSATGRAEARGGAVISQIETTERRVAQANLRELSGKMITSLEDERSRIARELHDDVSQRLALMGIEMEQIMQALPGKQDSVRKRLRELWGQNQEISSEVRQLSHNLHSTKLEYLGLVAAVNSLCNELSKHHGLRIRFKHLDVSSSIPTKVALCIYRVVQESLGNVVKHSGAQEAQVTLTGLHGEINLRISDEGAGFDPETIKTKGGIGLIGIRERLLLIGGEVSIESQPSHGTRIVARVPLPEQGQDTTLKRSVK